MAAVSTITRATRAILRASWLDSPAVGELTRSPFASGRDPSFGVETTSPWKTAQGRSARTARVNQEVPGEGNRGTNTYARGESSSDPV